MRTRNVWKRLAIAFALVTMLATGAIWEVRRARAFNPQPDPPGRYTMVGIVRGQSLRINVSNITPSDSNAPPDPCRVRLAFADVDGNVLHNPSTGEPVRRTVTLENGQSAFLQLNADEFFVGDVTAGRLELRPVFLSQSERERGSQIPPPCTSALEAINNSTLTTSFVYPGVQVSSPNNHNETLVRDTTRRRK